MTNIKVSIVLSFKYKGVYICGFLDRIGDSIWNGKCNKAQVKKLDRSSVRRMPGHTAVKNTNANSSTRMKMIRNVASAV